MRFKIASFDAPRAATNFGIVLISSYKLEAQKDFLNLILLKLKKFSLKF